MLSKIMVGMAGLAVLLAVGCGSVKPAAQTDATSSAANILAIRALAEQDPAFAPDMKVINWGELRTNCIQEIELGKFTALKNIKVTDFRILAWYRMKDERPWYVDNALCWAKVASAAGPRWALVHMARNPMRATNERERTWHSCFVTDVPNGWLLYFDKPPANKELYWHMAWFKFKGEGDWWTVFDAHINAADWVAALGEKPTKRFSTQRHNSGSEAKAPAMPTVGVCEATHPVTNAVVASQALNIDTLRKHAAQGNAEAQYQLGECYYEGKGVLKNKAEGFTWHQNAARNGCARAQCSLGFLYEGGGDGVLQDWAEAATWFRKAAEQGDAVGQLNIGFCYLNGHGVLEDCVEAYKWFRLAGAYPGETARSQLAERMTDAQIAEGEARAKQWQKAFKQSRAATK